LEPEVKEYHAKAASLQRIERAACVPTPSHAKATLTVFGPADFGTELDRARRVIGHLEGADREPNREDIALCCQVVEVWWDGFALMLEGEAIVAE
jgi:hypothetical protein